jgi:type IV secretory pathway TrbL component
MTVGLSATTANAMIDGQFTTVWVKLHTGDPGSAGSAAASSVTTRSQSTRAAASAGSSAQTGTKPSWPTWAGTNNEAVTHVSLFSASSGGTFLGSCALASSKTMQTGDTLNLDSLTISLSPIAA